MREQEARCGWAHRTLPIRKRTSFSAPTLGASWMFLHEGRVARPWKSSWYMLDSLFHLGSLFLKTVTFSRFPFASFSASPSGLDESGCTATVLPWASTEGTTTCRQKGGGGARKEWRGSS